MVSNRYASEICLQLSSRSKSVQGRDTSLCIRKIEAKETRDFPQDPVCCWNQRPSGRTTEGETVLAVAEPHGHYKETPSLQALLGARVKGTGADH